MSNTDVPSVPTGRSPALNEDEWIVLLDVYLHHRSSSLSPSHPAVAEASQTLNVLGRATGRGGASHFRSASGLSRQLEVFRRLAAGSPESAKVPRLAAQVWQRFSGRPEACKAAAASIREGLGGPA